MNSPLKTSQNIENQIAKMFTPCAKHFEEFKDNCCPTSNDFLIKWTFPKNIVIKDIQFCFGVGLAKKEFLWVIIINAWRRENGN